MHRLVKSIFLFLFFCPVFVFAEEITITTYYPSPYGSYNELGTNKFAVDIAGVAVATEFAAMQIGDAHIGRSLIIGAGGGSGFAYDEGATTADGTLLVKGNVGIGTTAPTYQLELSTDSAAKPTTNVWSIASDKRIKKNIFDFTDGLNIVMKLKPRTYQYNGFGGKGYDDTNTHVGFVAQEVEPIAPYMVETTAGVIGGAQVSDFKNYQGHALPFILVNAIHEQQDIIKAQQRDIEGLKARLDKLERK